VAVWLPDLSKQRLVLKILSEFGIDSGKEPPIMYVEVSLDKAWSKEKVSPCKGSFYASICGAL
jgi:hypothetical protein